MIAHNVLFFNFRGPVDTIDQALVRMLAQHGRMTHEHLAQTMHVSRPTVHERIKRREAQGIIRGYFADVA